LTALGLSDNRGTLGPALLYVRSDRPGGELGFPILSVVLTRLDGKVAFASARHEVVCSRSSARPLIGESGEFRWIMSTRGTLLFEPDPTSGKFKWSGTAPRA
jgi:hypothetical protein